MIRLLLLVAMLAGCSTTEQLVPTTHNSYRVALEQAILSQCGIDVDIKQTEKYSSFRGTISGEVTEISCISTVPTTIVTMTPPVSREDSSPLDMFTLHYELEFLGTVFIRVRACDASNICSAWRSLE